MAMECRHKVRYGLNGRWRPYGMLRKSGPEVKRTPAILRLRILMDTDCFVCHYSPLGPDLSLRDTPRICGAHAGPARIPERWNRVPIRMRSITSIALPVPSPSLRPTPAFGIPITRSE